MSYENGVFALLGVVIGTLGTFLVDWRRRNWEEGLRTQESRRNSYIAMASTPLLAMFDAQLMSATRRTWGGPRAIDHFAHLRDSLKTIVGAASEVFIFATSAEVTRAARRVLEISEQIGELMEQRTTKPEEWDKALQRMSDARMGFIEAARTELMVEGDFNDLFPSHKEES